MPKPPKRTKELTTTRYRKKRGFSRQRLHALKKKGRIKFHSNGDIDEQATDAATAVAQAAAQLRSPERKLKEMYEAKMAKLNYEKAAGLVVEAEKVKSEAFRLGRSLRNAILNVPKRVCGPIAAEKDPKKCEAMLTKELSLAMNGLIA